MYHPSPGCGRCGRRRGSVRRSPPRRYCWPAEWDGEAVASLGDLDLVKGWRMLEMWMMEVSDPIQCNSMAFFRGIILDLTYLSISNLSNLHGFAVIHSSGACFETVSLWDASATRRRGVDVDGKPGQIPSAGKVTIVSQKLCKKQSWILFAWHTSIQNTVIHSNNQ